METYEDFKRVKYFEHFSVSSITEPMFYATERINVAVTLSTRIWGIFGSNLGWAVGYPGRSFS
jgi:hypothetical protein